MRLLPFALIVLSTTCLAQDQKPPEKPPLYKPYDQVITAEAKTQEGMFKVHQIDEKFYFEVPKDALNRDMLWQSQQAAIPYAMGGIGPDKDRIVNWVRRGNKLFLQALDYSYRSVDSTGLDLGVKSMNPPGIIAAFKIEAEGKDNSAVIDVSDWLISDPNDLQIGPSWNGQLQRNRSYVDKVKAFPENVEMQSLLTFQVNRMDTLPGTNASYAAGLGPNASVMMHYSLTMLPENPMMPRFRDPRVGFFGFQIMEFGGPEHRGTYKEIIRRFRLEKKDPTAAVSDPIKPITFYLAPEMPAKWRPYAKKAVEAWQPAFTQAGFSNAIFCKDAPTRAEDPDFDIEDARYSVIRWVPSGIENAFGIQLADPRSGEVMSGRVVFYHSFLSWLQNLYFTQVSALDPTARKLPFSDEKLGELLTFILTHEVGHTLGLEHNMKASSAYSIANLRDPAFVAKHDIASSIMDYARFNFVSQPGDNVPLKRAIGEYDKFAIEWGYSQVPNAASPDDEKPLLNAIAARQNTNPFLRFGNYNHFEDPLTIGEDLSSDPVEAARLGMLNLRRSATYLVPAAVKPNADYEQLAQTYRFVANQQIQLLDNVIRLVGGVYADDHLMMNGQKMYRPVPAIDQSRAVKFICGENGIPPAELLSPEITGRLFASGDLARMTNFQQIVVFSVFDERRITRLFDQEASLGSKAYSVKQLLQDVQDSVWPQLASEKPQIDIYRRHYQRRYLRTLDEKLNGPTQTRTDLLPLGRASLQALARKIDKAIPKTADEATALHLQDCRRRIEEIIKGTSPAARVPAAVGAPPRTAGQASQFGCAHLVDWMSLLQK